MSRKRWILKQFDRETANKLSESGHFSGLLSVLLAGRGFTDAQDAIAYINCANGLEDPFCFADMDKAVKRIEAAIEGFERIAVYGDYDADGVTATAVLYSYLCARDADVSYYIPMREGEGYGLNNTAIDRLHDMGVQLVITVDNGVTALDEITYAASLGIDVVVTDHHTPSEILPQACAVVNPHRDDCPSVFKDYAGVGVAFKLVQALEGGEPDALIAEYADLVSIGTMGDVVPLKGENRALVQKGLAQLSVSGRPGILALLDAAGMTGRSLTGTNIAFSLVPRINAAGRMGSPSRAVRLLLTEDSAEAADLAREINEENQLRQKTEKDILLQAEAMLEQNKQMLYDRVLVLSGEGWHKGVIGIVASKLMERYGKPCIMIARDEEMAKGSGRSVPGFSLYDAIAASKDLLTRFGGHTLAAGVELRSENVDRFRKAVNQYAAERYPVPPAPVLFLDCKLRPASISLPTISDLHYLEPFGCENPAPTFGLFGMRLDGVVPLAGGKHIRLNLSKNNHSISAVWFGITMEHFPYRQGEQMDLAVSLSVSDFRGELSLSVFIKDARPAGIEDEGYRAGFSLYESMKRGEELKQEEVDAVCPDRGEMASVFRSLKMSNGFCGRLDLLYSRVKIPCAKLLVALDVLSELSLIEYENDLEQVCVHMMKDAGKVNLQDSAILEKLKPRG